MINLNTVSCVYQVNNHLWTFFFTTNNENNMKVINNVNYYGLNCNQIKVDLNRQINVKLIISFDSIDELLLLFIHSTFHWKQSVNLN